MPLKVYMKLTGNSVWVPGALTPPKGLTPPWQPDTKYPHTTSVYFTPCPSFRATLLLKSSWRVWNLHPFRPFQSWLHTSGICGQPCMKMPVIRIIVQINLWVFLGGYLDWIHWWGKTHPKCGWHHSMDWDPRLRKAKKWAKDKDPSLSATWLMQQWEQPSPALCHA